MKNKSLWASVYDDIVNGSKTEFSVDYFLNKFAAIDEEYWTVDRYKGPAGRCTALGHCSYDGNFSKAEAKSLIVLLQGWAMAINDGHHPNYPQSHPRARIINALCDVREGKFKP